MEVAEEDGGLRAGDDQDDEDQEEKAVHVINLAAPDAIQDEEELNEDTSKGEDASHDDPRNGLSVDGLVGDLTWDLVRPHRLLDRRFPEAEVGSDEGEGDGDTEPECQQGDEGEERNGSTGGIIPEDQVEDEEVSEDDARTQHGGEEDVALPLLPPEALVNPG